MQTAHSIICYPANYRFKKVFVRCEYIYHYKYFIVMHLN
jgi:hypothetical protein